MFGVQYADRNRGWKNSSKMDEFTDEEEVIDYSFSELPVRERRKLFMNDQAPPRIQQYSTLPRTQANTRNRFETDTRSVANEWVPQTRRSFAPKFQTGQRPNSVYAGQKMNSRESSQYHGYTRECDYPQSNASHHVNEQQIQQSYVSPRQSRPQQRPQLSPTTLQPMENYRNYTSTATRVIPARHTSITIGSRERDSSSMGPESWPEAQYNSQIGRPLRVRVYNSDRPALSPNYAQSVSSWAPVSPVYPAYPAYSSRPSDGNNRIYQVVQSQTKSYPRDTDTLSVSAYPFTPIYAPSSPKQRVPIPRSTCSHDPITIYESMPRKCSTAVFQPSSQIRNRIQPTRVNEVHAPLPRKSYAYSPNRKVVNRRTPPPEDDKGVSEF